MKLENHNIKEKRSILGYKYIVIKAKISEEKQKYISDIIEISDHIYYLDNVNVFIENKIDPKYSAKEGRIFIPLEYIENNNNDIFTTLKSIIGKAFEDFIIFHEMGHAVEVNRKTNLYQINIKKFSELNYLFNGASVPNNINYFLMENYKEGFADCYAGLCYYIKHGDINIFDRITKVRELRYKEMKKNYGVDWIHPNFNTEAPKILKQKIEELNKQEIDIRTLPFLSRDGKNIENFIEEATIKGLLKTLVRELETNDTFFSHFKKVGKEFTEEDKGKFKINVYSDVIKEYATKNNIQIKDLVERLNNEAILPYFIEFQKRSNTDVVSNDFLQDLIDNPKFKRNVPLFLKIENVKELGTIENIEQERINNLKINAQVNIKELRVLHSNDKNNTLNKFNYNKHN